MSGADSTIEAGARIERVVCGVVAAAVRDAGAPGVLLLEDQTPEGGLAYGWLVRQRGAAEVWRAGAVASNVHAAAAAGPAADALVAHPANRTALLLGGRLPFCDLLPLGDVWASQVEALAGGWSAPPEVEALARQAGGVAALDEALARLLDERRDRTEALGGLDHDVARRLTTLYERGRWYRLRCRLVPKLGMRTLGMDLFD